MGKQFWTTRSGAELRRPEKKPSVRLKCLVILCICEFNFQTSDQASDSEAIELQMFQSTIRLRAHAYLSSGRVLRLAL